MPVFLVFQTILVSDHWHSVTLAIRHAEFSLLSSPASHKSKEGMDKGKHVSRNCNLNTKGEVYCCESLLDCYIDNSLNNMKPGKIFLDHISY